MIDPRSINKSKRPAPKRIPYKRPSTGQAQSEGKHFEGIIEHSCKWYEAKAEAKIDKSPEPIRILEPRGGGRFLCHFEKKAQPDFKGIIKGGRSICFEAKHTTTDRITFDRVKPWQLQYLDKFEYLGGIAFVFVGIKLTQFYRVPIKVWKNMKELYGHQYMNSEELAPFEIKRIGGHIPFLDGIIKE